ncbi:asparaginase [Qipengyuania sediminis]|uniref:asparaginase n=1 Tax=Qipengyuania sediminis TaxID=1532023 RepID=UPI001F10966D|nr:asparaginase [Qipengyuania sediminis]
MKHLRVLATGGTIAGSGAGGAGRAYAPGRIGIAEMAAEVRALGLPATLEAADIAAIGSQDIGWAEWSLLHQEIAAAQNDGGIDGTIITHGTDSAEETALLLDLTRPAGKPVVIVGAMRPADAVGSDGMRNFANSVRVASDSQASGRGVMVVMGDQIFAAVDVRKARTSSVDAFRGFPRGPIAAVTPSSLDWFGPPARVGEGARLPWPEALPQVDILYAYAGMAPCTVEALLGCGARGLVLAGMGQGNAPARVLDALADAVRGGIPVVRASRVDQGTVDRNLEVDDDARGFVAARAFGPAKARILLQLLIASGIREAREMQAQFDRR